MGDPLYILVAPSFESHTLFRSSHKLIIISGEMSSIRYQERYMRKGDFVRRKGRNGDEKKELMDISKVKTDDEDEERRKRKRRRNESDQLIETSFITTILFSFI